MKTFEAPEAKFRTFEAEDIIVTSPETETEAPTANPCPRDVTLPCNDDF